MYTHNTYTHTYMTNTYISIKFPKVITVCTLRMSAQKFYYMTCNVSYHLYF